MTGVANHELRGCFPLIGTGSLCYFRVPIAPYYLTHCSFLFLENICQAPVCQPSMKCLIQNSFFFS